MNILVAMDSFKGSLSSIEAGDAVKAAVQSVDKNAVVEVFPVADGGEGLTQALLAGRVHEVRTIRVTGPLGREVEATYGIYERTGGKCAVIEMAAAAGLTLVPEDMRNPMITTTYGVGEMIMDAIAQGCRSFIIGIGGSATNDAGIGMLLALGYRFTDAAGSEVSFGATAVRDTVCIHEQDVPDVLRTCDFRVVCDVKNPLYGEDGCSMVFSPQKGASREQALEMDRWMEQFAGVVRESYPKADAFAEGAGAAGGLGFALRTFLHAGLERGIETVLRENGFAGKVATADLVITGEGRLDAQTAMGKVPAGVAACAKRFGVRVLAFGGSVDRDAIGLLEACGIDECVGITPAGMPIEEAMRKEVAAENLTRAVAEKIDTEFVRKDEGDEGVV